MDPEVEKEFKEVYKRIMDLHDHNKSLNKIINDLTDIVKDQKSQIEKLIQEK